MAGVLQFAGTDTKTERATICANHAEELATQGVAKLKGQLKKVSEAALRAQLQRKVGEFNEQARNKTIHLFDSSEIV